MAHRLSLHQIHFFFIIHNFITFWLWHTSFSVSLPIYPIIQSETKKTWRILHSHSFSPFFLRILGWLSSIIFNLNLFKYQLEEKQDTENGSKEMIDFLLSHYSFFPLFVGMECCALFAHLVENNEPEPEPARVQRCWIEKFKPPSTQTFVSKVWGTTFTW